jgi:hypothetical protein
LPTIRIDEEVWAWLKSLAVPFEDTPNSVLRRVSGIDASDVETPRIPFTPPRIHDLRTTERPPAHASLGAAPSPPSGRRVTGEWLNKTFHLHAAHALYHKDGLLYERFTQFPGVLCDARGWVRFENEEEFVNDPAVSIGAKVNVAGGIASHPRYQNFPRAES